MINCDWLFVYQLGFLTDPEQYCIVVCTLTYLYHLSILVFTTYVIIGTDSCKGNWATILLYDALSDLPIILLSFSLSARISSDLPISSQHHNHPSCCQVSASMACQESGCCFFKGTSHCSYLATIPQKHLCSRSALPSGLVIVTYWT